MTITSQISNSPGVSILTTRRATHVVVGGIVGLAVGVAALFVLVTLYGQAIGLAPANCAVLSCVLTLLLSQPVGILGMVAGATVGAVTGGVVHHKRYAEPR
jgi:hypothetical protein